MNNNDKPALIDPCSLQQAVHELWDCFSDNQRKALNERAAELAEAASVNNRIRAVRAVVEERHRQVTAEGFTLAGDDAYKRHELARAAACYITPHEFRDNGEPHPPPVWPWRNAWWKPSPDDRLKELRKGLALGLAEYERLLRLGEQK